MIGSKSQQQRSLHLNAQQWQSVSNSHDLDVLLSTLKGLFLGLQHAVEQQTRRLCGLELSLESLLSVKLDTLANIGLRTSMDIAKLAYFAEKQHKRQLVSRQRRESLEKSVYQSPRKNRHRYSPMGEDKQYSGLPSPIRKKRPATAREIELFTTHKGIRGEKVELEQVLQLSAVQNDKQLKMIEETKQMKDFPSQQKDLPCAELTNPPKKSALQVDSKNSPLVGQQFFVSSQSAFIISTNEKSEEKHKPLHYCFASQQQFPQNQHSNSTFPLPMVINDFKPIHLKAYLQKLVGEFTTDLSSRMYHKYSKGTMLQSELKAEFSWNIMLFSLNFDRFVITTCRNHSFRLDNNALRQLALIFDTSIRHILEFLIAKYPPSKHKILDTDLAKHITEVRRTGDLHHDILLNAGYSFVDDTGKTDFSRDIKLWLNKIIQEIRRTYPGFRHRMKELFVGAEGSLDGGEEQIQYQIGSKISETVEMYTEKQLNEPGLMLKSPQTQRVLIKWVDEIRLILTKAQRVISENKNGFKSSNKGGSCVFHLNNVRREQLIKNLKQICVEMVYPERTHRRKRLMETVSEVLSLLCEGIESHEQIPQQEILGLFASHYLDNCSQAFLQNILNGYLHHLNLIRKKYSSDKIQSTIDLVSFNVLDLLRCRCVGSKKDIRRIYSTLVNCPNTEILRVKNKLNQPTRDLLINFRSKDTFLVWQMQLALGDRKDQINDHFSHYLYELHRSFFPVLFQVGSQVVASDPRARYLDGQHTLHVRIKKRRDYQELIASLAEGTHIMSCSFSHPASEMTFVKNDMPFCCSLCSQFVEGHHYGLELVRCHNCGVSICPKCAIEHCPMMQSVYLKRHLNTELAEGFLTTARPIAFTFGTEKHLLAKINEQLTKSKYVLVCVVTKKGLHTLLLKRINQQLVTTFYTLTKGKIVDFTGDTEHTWNAVLPLNQPETFELSAVKQFPKLLVDDEPWHYLQQELEFNGHTKIVAVHHRRLMSLLVIDVVEHEEAVSVKLHGDLIQRQINSEKDKPDIVLELSSKGLTDLAMLHKMQQPQKLRSLNLWGNQLFELPRMDKFTGLTELILRDNLIASIEHVHPLTKLQLLNLHGNRLSQVLSLPLPELEMLDLSCNQLQEVDALSQRDYPKLLTLYINENKLEKLPVLHCPSLEVFYFVNNRIKGLEELIRSKLVKLASVRATANKIEGSLPKLHFTRLTNLAIDQNMLTSITSLEHLPALERLVIDGNNLQSELFKITSKKVKSISINKNQLTNIDEIQNWHLQQVIDISLSDNDIAGPLPSLRIPTLLSLNLSNNALTSILNLSDSNLESLVSLILSGNRINQLPRLSYMKLEQLDVSRNQLTSVQQLEHSRLPRLRVLNIASNLLERLPPVLYLPGLVELDIANNSIATIECLRNQEMLPHLRRVVLKGNVKMENEMGSEQLMSSRGFYTFAIQASSVQSSTNGRELKS